MTEQPYWVTVRKLRGPSFAHGNPTYCPGVEGYDFKSSNLTAYVQEGANKGWDPLVFGLRVPSSYLGNVNSFKRLRNNPVLEVTYNFPPSVSTAGAYEGSWAPDGEGNKPVPCGATIGNSGLALTATLYDGDGGTVSPDFVVTKSSGASVPVSNVTSVAGGGTATATVLASNLSTGSYTWKVRAKDGEGPDSPFTANCAFTVDKTGPSTPVTVTKEDGSALTVAHPARTALRLKLKNPASDLAGFCYSLDLPLSVSGATCSSNTWVPLAAGATEAVIEVVPTGRPQSTLNVIAYDKAGNHSSTDGAADTIVIKTSPSSFVYPTGQTPLTKTATKDLHGDLNGDGFIDMLAIESDSKLRFYATDGTGKHKPSVSIGTSGWGGALIAHGGDFGSLTSPTAAPDGYEDAIVRLKNNKLYVYPGNGLGRLWNTTRRELAPPSDLGPMGWGRVLQITAPGDIDKRTDPGFENGNDLAAIECVDDACTSARLRIYSGRTVAGGGADQSEPFDVQQAGFTSNTWKNYTVLAIGDQNGDGVKDFLSRSKIDGNLYFYPGQIGANGKYGLGTRAIYATGGWEPANRPLITTNGNAQGTVVNKTVDDDGTLIPYREFQPKAGDGEGDLWATTPADPNYTVNYVDAAGNSQSTTCPSGCLLFYPGLKTAPRAPLLVGTSGWATTITGLF